MEFHTGAAQSLGDETVAIRFVMRDMGNGVFRAESPGLIRGRYFFGEEQGFADTAALDEVLPWHLQDLAESAMAAVGAAALGYLLAAPVRGWVRFLEDRVTEITIRLISALCALAVLAPAADFLAVV